MINFRIRLADFSAFCTSFLNSSPIYLPFQKFHFFLTIILSWAWQAMMSVFTVTYEEETNIGEYRFNKAVHGYPIRLFASFRSVVHCNDNITGLVFTIGMPRISKNFSYCLPNSLIVTNLLFTLISNIIVNQW